MCITNKTILHTIEHRIYLFYIYFYRSLPTASTYTVQYEASESEEGGGDNDSDEDVADVCDIEEEEKEEEEVKQEGYSAGYEPVIDDEGSYHAGGELMINVEEEEEEDENSFNDIVNSGVREGVDDCILTHICVRGCTWQCDL
jgi:hypothetical protein